MGTGAETASKMQWQSKQPGAWGKQEAATPSSINQPPCPYKTTDHHQSPKTQNFLSPLLLQSGPARVFLVKIPKEGKKAVRNGAGRRQGEWAAVA